MEPTKANCRSLSMSWSVVVTCAKSLSIRLQIKLIGPWSLETTRIPIVENKALRRSTVHQPKRVPTAARTVSGSQNFEFSISDCELVLLVQIDSHSKSEIAFEIRNSKFLNV